MWESGWHIRPWRHNEGVYTLYLGRRLKWHALPCVTCMGSNWEVVDRFDLGTWSGSRSGAGFGEWIEFLSQARWGISLDHLRRFESGLKTPGGVYIITCSEFIVKHDHPIEINIYLDYKFSILKTSESKMLIMGWDIELPESNFTFSRSFEWGSTGFCIGMWRDLPTFSHRSKSPTCCSVLRTPPSCPHGFSYFSSSYFGVFPIIPSVLFSNVIPAPKQS